MLVGRTARSAWLEPVNDGLWVLCRLPGFARCVRLLLNDRPGGTEMGQLTTVEAANWMALYLATGNCCAMALALSIGMMLCAVYCERSWTAVTSWQAADRQRTRLHSRH